MKISTKGRYALRTMIDIALNEHNGLVTLKHIWERQGITVKYLEQIATLLLRAGFLKSQRGNGGGYKLGMFPEKITVGSILRAAEGSIAPISCLEKTSNPCPRNIGCPTLPFWKNLHEVINTYVDSVTLQDLVDNANKANNDFCI